MIAFAGGHFAKGGQSGAPISISIPPPWHTFLFIKTFVPMANVVIIVNMPLKKDSPHNIADSRNTIS